MSLFEFWSRVPNGATVHPDDRPVLDAGPHAFHFGLPALPVLGRLKDAPVVLCYGNPGFAEHDARHADESGRRARLFRQSAGTDPYPAWMPGWGDLLAARCRQIGLGLEDLASTVALFNVVPYASERLGVNETSIARHLASAAEARSYLHEVLVPRARREEIFLVVVHSHVLWGAVDMPDSHTCRFPRHLALDGKLGVVGMEIRAWLDHRRLAAAS
jgi:hypothetical protein